MPAVMEAIDHMTTSEKRLRSLTSFANATFTTALKQGWACVSWITFSPKI